MWFKSDAQTIWTPTSSHFPNQFIKSTDAQSRFDPHDEPPAVERTIAIPHAIDNVSRLSGNLAPRSAILLGAIGGRYVPPGTTSHHATTAITTAESSKRRHDSHETLQDELARIRRRDISQHALAMHPLRNGNADITERQPVQPGASSTP